MCEIRGVGVDLCVVDRMRERVEERFLSRFFTPSEAAYVRSRGQHASESLAGLWAAKEAVLKALGTGLTLPLTDVEITHTEAGQPLVRLHGQAAALGGQVLVSITHDGGMAAAFAVWTR